MGAPVYQGKAVYHVPPPTTVPGCVAASSSGAAPPGSPARMAGDTGCARREELHRAWERVGDEERTLREREARVGGLATSAVGA